LRRIPVSKISSASSNALSTGNYREEEERARREEEKAKKNNKNKNKKKAESPAAQPAPTLPLNGVAAAPAKEWTPAQYGGYVPPAGGGGGGQVLIKSVNGKVVITPVPGTGNNPPLSGNNPTTPLPIPAPAVASSAPPPPAAKPQSPAAAPATLTLVNGKPSPVVNGSGPAVVHNNICENGQVQ
jgi:hypothetical protein